MRANLLAVRGQVRLISALVLLAFVVCHTTGHILLLISPEAAESGLPAHDAVADTGRH